MTSEPDWRTLIDESFGDGPGHRPVEDRLVTGRRALRRRRIVVSAATVAFAVVAGGGAWAAVPSDSQTEAPLARPTHSTGSDPQSPTEPDLVTMTDSGWKVAPGWRVVVRIANPMEYEPPMRSVALEIKNESERRFVLAAYDGECCASVASTPAPAGTTLVEWLPAKVAIQRELDIANGDSDGEAASPPVEFGAGETLIPAEGVTILDQVAHPDLPSSFAGENDRSAAAWIDDHGQEKFVLARDIGRSEQVIPFTASFPNLDKFLRFAQKQYAGGEGLL
jgi:hypothetical protein